MQQIATHSLRHCKHMCVVYYSLLKKEEICIIQLGLDVVFHNNLLLSDNPIQNNYTFPFTRTSKIEAQAGCS